MGADGSVTISWAQLSGGTNSTVAWGYSEDALTEVAMGSSAVSYTCQDSTCGGPNYWSGFLHTAVLGPRVLPSSRVFYRVGEDANWPTFNFTSLAGPELVEGYAFALVGDLGQTAHSAETAQRIMSGGAARMVVHAGDLSYADCDQPRWDSYGRLMEPLASRVAWMTVTGNHEMEDPLKCGLSLNQSFAAYDARYGSALPFEASGSKSPRYYSFEVGGAHWIMLGSYTDYTPGSPQLEWLALDLASVNRTQTPWLLAVLHSPWYNSNRAHFNETEERLFRLSAEAMLVEAKLDAMFAGHVHAYERSLPVVDNEVAEKSTSGCNKAPIYLNIGDGGNHEGPAPLWRQPQPAWSAFREASFGHGTLELINASVAEWRWHRNDDPPEVAADSVYLTRCA